MALIIQRLLFFFLAVSSLQSTANFLPTEETPLQKMSKKAFATMIKGSVPNSNTSNWVWERFNGKFKRVCNVKNFIADLTGFGAPRFPKNKMSRLTPYGEQIALNIWSIIATTLQLYPNGRLWSSMDCASQDFFLKLSTHLLLKLYKADLVKPDEKSEQAYTKQNAKEFVQLVRDLLKGQTPPPVIPKQYRRAVTFLAFTTGQKLLRKYSPPHLYTRRYIPQESASTSN
jgi:hypothetical protein